MATPIHSMVVPASGQMHPHLIQLRNKTSQQTHVQTNLRPNTTNIFVTTDDRFGRGLSHQELRNACTSTPEFTDQEQSPQQLDYYAQQTQYHLQHYSSNTNKSASVTPPSARSSSSSAQSSRSASNVRIQRQFMLLDPNVALRQMRGAIIEPKALIDAVNQCGGIKEVVRLRRWQRVRSLMKLPQTSSSGNQLLRAWELYFGETPDVWKPKHLRSTASLSSDEGEQEEDYYQRNMRGIDRIERPASIVAFSGAESDAESEDEIEAARAALSGTVGAVVHRATFSSAASTDHVDYKSMVTHKMKGVVVDPKKLKQVVDNMGGFQACCERRLWQKVRRTLEIPHSSSSGNNLIRIWKLYFGTIDHRPFLVSKKQKNKNTNKKKKEKKKNGEKGRSSSKKYYFERTHHNTTKKVKTKERLKALIKQYKAGGSSSSSSSLSSSSSSTGSCISNDMMLKDPWYFWGKTSLESFQPIKESDIQYLKHSIGYNDNYDHPTLGKYYREHWNDVDFVDAFREQTLSSGGADGDGSDGGSAHFVGFDATIEDPRKDQTKDMPRVEEVWFPPSSSFSSSSSSSSSSSLPPPPPPPPSPLGDQLNIQAPTAGPHTIVPAIPALKALAIPVNLDTSDDDEDSSDDEGDEVIDQELTILQASLKQNRTTMVNKMVHLGNSITNESLEFLNHPADERSFTSTFSLPSPSSSSIHYSPQDVKDLSNNIQTTLTSSLLHNQERPLCISPNAVAWNQGGNNGSSSSGGYATTKFKKNSIGAQSSASHESIILNESSSAESWNNQLFLRATAKALHVKAGGTNEEIRQRIIAASSMSAKNPPPKQPKKVKRSSTPKKNMLGQKILLVNGYHCKQKYIGYTGIIEKGIEFPGGWYEVSLLNNDNELNGEQIMWRKSAMVIQKDTARVKKKRPSSDIDERSPMRKKQKRQSCVTS